MPPKRAVLRKNSDSSDDNVPLNQKINKPGPSKKLKRRRNKAEQPSASLSTDTSEHSQESLPNFLASEHRTSLDLDEIFVTAGVTKYSHIAYVVIALIDDERQAHLDPIHAEEFSDDSIDFYFHTCPRAIDNINYIRRRIAFVEYDLPSNVVNYNKIVFTVMEYILGSSTMATRSRSPQRTSSATPSTRIYTSNIGVGTPSSRLQNVIGVVDSARVGTISTQIQVPPSNIRQSIYYNASNPSNNRRLGLHSSNIHPYGYSCPQCVSTSYESTNTGRLSNTFPSTVTSEARQGLHLNVVSCSSRPIAITPPQPEVRHHENRETAVRENTENENEVVNVVDESCG